MSCELYDFKTEIIHAFFRNFTTDKPIVKKFISDYLDFIEMYSNMSNFIRFNKKIPVLTNLQPQFRSLIVVYFENEQEYFCNTSVFPICLFTAYFRNKVLMCTESINLLLLYLEIANITTVGFYKLYNWETFMSQIKKYNPKIKCYPPSSFYYFCKLNKIYKRASQN